MQALRKALRMDSEVTREIGWVLRNLREPRRQFGGKPLHLRGQRMGRYGHYGRVENTQPSQVHTGGSSKFCGGTTDRDFGCQRSPGVDYRRAYAVPERPWSA